jgi:hypothetical protein
VRQLGVDETSFPRANRHHHKIYVLPEHNGSRQRHRHFQIRNRCGPIDTLQIADIDLHPILRLGTASTQQALRPRLGRLYLDRHLTIGFGHAE